MVQLQEMVTSHETQMNKVIKERDDFRNYKQDEVASFKVCQSSSLSVLSFSWT
jgi:hypothetical protein